MDAVVWEYLKLKIAGVGIPLVNVAVLMAIGVVVYYITQYAIKYLSLAGGKGKELSDNLLPYQKTPVIPHRAA